MSRTEQLIQEISQLPDTEAQEVYQALTKQLALKVKTEHLIARVTGTGAGIWDSDAQKYVTQLRQHDRF